MKTDDGSRLLLTTLGLAALLGLVVGASSFGFGGALLAVIGNEVEQGVFVGGSSLTVCSLCRWGKLHVST